MAHPAVFVSGDGAVVEATEPLHDDENAAISLAMSFARAVAERYPEDRVLLVRAAVGGSSIVRWFPDGGERYAWEWLRLAGRL